MLILTESAARDRARFLAVPSRAFLLGIVGAPGAGKSTFAAVIAEDNGAPILPMDGYHLADEYLEALGRKDRKGAPDTFDAAGYVSALRRLRSGEDVIAPRFDRGRELAVAGALPVPAGSRLVVTEGNYLLHPADGWGPVAGLLDEIWYLDPPDEVRVPRLIARHRGFGRSAEEAAAWVASVDEPNTLLIRAGRDRAGVIVTPDPATGGASF